MEKPLLSQGSTEVLTNEGFVSIDEIKLSRHLVLAKDETSDKQEWKPVLHQFLSSYDSTIYLQVEDQGSGVGHTIKSNKYHPFFIVRDPALGFIKTSSETDLHSYDGEIENGRWVFAEDLLIGDKFLNSDGTWSYLTGKAIEKEGLVAYNLDVEGFDNFYVRGEGAQDAKPVWVHNCDVPSVTKKELHRPYTRKGTRAEVEAQAPTTSDGRFIDPNSGLPIDGKYDLGHKPGHEFRREKARAEAEGLSQKDFNNRMNNPDLYQIENPSLNRSYKYEKPGND